MTAPMATLVVEYPCARRCQVELDLTDIHIRFTHGQMLRAAESAHLQAHERAAVKTLTVGSGATVRAATGYEPAAVHDTVVAERGAR